MTVLYPFQTEGAAFLAGRPRAYLADEMGLGKTVQALDAVRRLGGTPRVLVGCPASVIENWRREIERSGVDAAFWVHSYGKAPPVGPWGVVILDEAHYLKNPRAKRTKSWLAVAGAAGHAWALSGTPTPNHPGELHTVARAFFPDQVRARRLWSYAAWLDTFTKWSMTKYGPRPYAVRNPDVLREFLSPWMLRRTVADVALDLPPLRVDTHLLPRDGKVAEAFERLGMGSGTGSAEEWLSIMRASAVRDKMSLLRHYLGLYKAPHIADVLTEELRDGAYDKIVVLAYHHDVLDVLAERLTGFGLVHIDGTIQPSARQIAIDKFTNDPRTRVFLGQQNAVGTGTNLQAAHEVVLVEPDWSPEVNRQYLKRIHRIGQGTACRARLFAVRGTLDDGLMHVLAAKSSMIESTIGGV